MQLQVGAYYELWNRPSEFYTHFFAKTDRDWWREAGVCVALLFSPADCRYPARINNSTNLRGGAADDTIHLSGQTVTPIV